LEQRQKKHLKVLLQLFITAVAVTLVVKKIDLHLVGAILEKSHIAYLVIAFAAFNISKVISAIRLMQYFRVMSLKIECALNLMLYYIGMFYNLFLPGGIGGDGYKIYWLNKHYSARVLQLFKALLLDRISGLYGLGFLMLTMLPWSQFVDIFPWLKPVSIALLILVYPAAYIFNRLFFSSFLSVFAVTSVQGLVVQVFQLICAVCILFAINVEVHISEYLVVFLISSIVAVLPLTIGGIGARELTFVYLLGMIQLDVHQGVALSVIFFVITALSSLIGAGLIHRLEASHQQRTSDLPGP